MYFLLILLLNIELPRTHALQSTEETNNENAWEKYLSKFRFQNEQEELQTVIKTEIEKIYDEINQSKKETDELTPTSTADSIMRGNRRALSKGELKQANQILLHVRDHLYHAENVCLKSIDRTSFTPLSKSSTTQVNHGKHYNRWMVFFDKCNHEDFLTISTKSVKSLDRSIFSEQIDVLFSLTNNVWTVGTSRVALEDQWYKKAIYSKLSLLESLKKHTNLDDNFLTFIGIMYDIVVAFNERWNTNV